MDLVEFVRSAKAVEKMQQREARFERSGMRNQGEVVRFLNGIGGQEAEAGRPRSHHIAVVAEYRKGMRRDGPCRDVDDAGGKLARDFVHVWDHQQKALRGGEGGAKGSRLQRTM